MYAEDQPLMAAHGLSSPDGLVDVITFVLCTIKQKLNLVGRQMEDIRVNGAESKYLFGSKRDGYRYAVEHKEVLFAAVSKGVAIGDVVGTVDVLTSVPGLGMVKASFVAQILGLDVACLDIHNLKALGLPETAFKLPKGVKRETKLARIAAYVKTCADTGGSAYWWNRWCTYVAGRRGSHLKTPEEVSRYHVDCLIASCWSIVSSTNQPGRGPLAAFQG
jgi:hypothetical protein